MLKHIFASALAALVVGLGASACDSGSIDYYGGPGRDGCRQYTSCGSCTPVDGCGWCATGPSQGLCASDPDECASAASFSWTWNADGCFAAADAGVSSVPEAGMPETSAAPPVDGAAPDASDASLDAATVDGADAALVDAPPGTDAASD